MANFYTIVKVYNKIMFEYVDKYQSNTEFALYKDTHREKVALNETPAFKKSTNMSI